MTRKICRMKRKLRKRYPQEARKSTAISQKNRKDKKKNEGQGKNEEQQGQKQQGKQEQQEQQKEQETCTKRAYLTFDDGPTAQTGEILDILKENNVKATFLLLEKTNRIMICTAGLLKKDIRWRFIHIRMIIIRYMHRKTIL